MKKRYMLLLFVVVFGAMLWYIIRQSSSVVTPSGNSDLAPSAQKATKDDLIVIDSPLPEGVVSNPIVVKGRARGNWFFEASAPVTVVNWDGVIIGTGYMTVDAGNDWMTTEYVPFSGTIAYDATKLGAYSYGWIIFKKDNPSGQPQFDNSLQVKINF